MRTLKDKTCWQGSYQNIHCQNCGEPIKHTSKLTDKKYIKKKCKNCGIITVITPPAKAIVRNKPVVIVGGCIFLSDNTEALPHLFLT